MIYLLMFEMSYSSATRVSFKQICEVFLAIF